MLVKSRFIVYLLFISYLAIKEIKLVYLLDLY